jgi:hypothetical protein
MYGPHILFLGRIFSYLAKKFKKEAAKRLRMLFEGANKS